MQPTTQTYNELQTAYDYFNKALFDDVLPPCILTLQREKKSMGYFCRKQFVRTDGAEHMDEIALNPVHFGKGRSDGLPDQETMQTLVHEMCHLWQFHFGNPGRSRYHNKEWADKMEEVGLMPSDTGRPGGKRTGDRVSDYAIEGGLFLKAYGGLLASDFCISWRDRQAALNDALLTAAASGCAIEVSGGGSVSLPLPPKPQTRVKYTCPECGSNVWGKPKLNLICGDCNEAFELAE